ncbi:MAG: DUF4910 domain-containing protein [Chloroflexi bacterium]|nr:DUF4910 domain-containing protein [Chloroflexota bacterium]
MIAFESKSPGARIDRETNGRIVEDLLRRLFPICRSITGEGLRTTLKTISEYVPLKIIEIPTGTQVFDWQIPDEWNIRDAYIKNEAGERIVDFRQSNLHVLNYSTPIHQKMTLEELRPHLHTLPAQPNAIPYLTSYYKRDWGFCLTHHQYLALSPGEYEVCIDGTLAPGSLTLAESILPGEASHQILFSTYCCHPSLANNELSGPIITTLLYQYLAALPKRRFTYHFYYGPETIGALAFLALHGKRLKENLLAGFVVTCCGDRGSFTYKQVRNPNNALDRVVLHVLKHSGVEFKAVPYFPTGSDERQYSSPGFDLPIGSLMRSTYGQYPEYHTSLDNLDFISIDSLLETLELYVDCVYALEHNLRYENLCPFGEPMLSKYVSCPRTSYTKKSRDIVHIVAESSHPHIGLTIA